MKKISIITPCRNSEKHIGETIESVINQTALISGRAELEYIIYDGNSEDQTKSIVESYDSKYIKFISRPDSGLYDALAKGLKMASGDIVAYINAGDYYHKCAFDIVLDIFETRQVHWLTGCNITYNEKSQITWFTLPYKYRRSFLESGIYGKILPFVVQETTFWSSALNSMIDFNRLSQFKLAGDYFLWQLFSQQANLIIVNSYLGGYKVMKGQLSENMNAYRSEMKQITRKPRVSEFILAYFDKLIWLTNTRVKKKLNRKGIFIYNHVLQRWI